MKLSLVIPTYKKEEVISQQLTRLSAFLDEKDLKYELIVVIDGILDNTIQRIKTSLDTDQLKNIKILSYLRNRGKGYAIRHGMKRATGDIVGFIDADLDIDLKTLEIALEAIKKSDSQVIVPSKYVEGANIKSSLKRKIFSAGLRFLNRLLVGQPPTVKEVSCGLKLFTKTAMQAILPNLTIDRFAIDSELFYWVKRLKLKVAVVPFYVKITDDSTSANIIEILTMLRDIINLTITVRLKNSLIALQDLVQIIYINIEKFTTM
jgi:glycosyltransferase involved in cell wall biosynthesis